MNRSARITLAKETLEILEAGSYRTASGQRVGLEPAQSLAVQSTQIYHPDDFPDPLPVSLPSYTGQTAIEVTSETSLEAVQRIISEGDINPFCLNFASAKNPGGGFLNGSQAQEELLARSSGLYPCLLQFREFYDFHRNLPTCLYSDTMLYSPQVPVIREDDGALLDPPSYVSFLTSPAVNAGAVRRNEPHNIPQIEPTMRVRAAKLLWVATPHQHDTLLLGAWGCGVFANDPALVARLFAEHLGEGGHFYGQFRRVVFAVYDRSEAQATLNAFHTEFPA